MNARRVAGLRLFGNPNLRVTIFLIEVVAFLSSASGRSALVGEVCTNWTLAKATT